MESGWTADTTAHRARGSRRPDRRSRTGFRASQASRLNDPARRHEARVLTSLLLVALIIAGVLLVREGPHFDNVIDGERFFVIAFFAGALAGFLLWTYFSGGTPVFSCSGANRNPWLA